MCFPLYAENCGGSEDISSGIISKYRNYTLFNILQMLHEYSIYDTVYQSEQSNCKRLYLISYYH